MRAVSRDKSLQHAVQRSVLGQAQFPERTLILTQKNNEAKLTPEVCQKILVRRHQYAKNNHLRSFEIPNLQDKLKDPVLFYLYESLKTGKLEDVFFRLYKQPQDGHLQTFERFMDICGVLSDRIHRDTPSNSNLKYGIRYSKSYLDFMIVMHGYGPNPNRQYSILTAEFLGPCIRHLQYVFQFYIVHIETHLKPD